MFLAPFNYIGKSRQIACRHVTISSAELLNYNMRKYWTILIAKDFCEIICCHKCVNIVTENNYHWKIKSRDSNTFMVFCEDDTGYINCYMCNCPAFYVLNRLILFGKFFNVTLICRICLSNLFDKPICDCEKKSLNEFYFGTICRNCLRDKFMEFQLCSFKFDYNEDITNLILEHLIAIKFYVKLPNFAKN